MWLVYILYPELNTPESSKKGDVLLARGLVRVDHMQVGHALTEKEARSQCVRLAVKTLKDRGYSSTVIGFGIRNYYAKKGSGLSWQLSLQQVAERLIERKQRKKAA